AAALCKINQEDVIRYIERHAQDWSPGTGKAMCWSLRAFLRYLHHRGLNTYWYLSACPECEGAIAESRRATEQTS
ncbi:hypothetical protein ABIB81_008853, partial [Bradyrhizobium sp. I1.7.5]